MLKVLPALATATLVLCFPGRGEGGDYGDLDPKRFPPSGWEAYTWQDPGGWKTLDVTRHGLPADATDVDAAKALKKVLADHPAGRIRLHFPPGVYCFKTACDLNEVRDRGGNVIFSGAGADKTEWRLVHPRGGNVRVAIIAGRVAATYNDPAFVKVTGGATRGSDRITVEDADGLEAGDFVVIVGNEDFGDKSSWCTRRGWHILRVEAVRGNELAVDLKLGMDVPDARVRKVELATNVGVEKLRITRPKAPTDEWKVANLHVHGVFRGFLRDCVVIDGNRQTVSVNGCKRFEVTGNTLRRFHGQARGGRGDGLTLTSSTQLHVFNNWLDDYRHHIWLLSGTCHAVIAYNRTGPRWRAYADIGNHHGTYCHNNLFEGNDGSEVITDAGAEFAELPDRWTTWYRNLGRRKVGSEMRTSRYNNVLANETPSLRAAGKDNYVGANRVGGRIRWGAVDRAARLPASLVYDEKPRDVGAWPRFGPRNRQKSIAVGFRPLADRPWRTVFADDGTGDWREMWTLDGRRAKVANAERGMEFRAGDTWGDDAHHAVLWTRPSFTGDVRMDYTYTRLDEATRGVTIIYVQATGDGRKGYARDIAKWADRRGKPAMSAYFNHMDTYHISYAAHGNEPGKRTKGDYIRARRYMPRRGRGLRGTALRGDVFDTGMFKTGVPHRITVIKAGRHLYMKVANDDRTLYCYWENVHFPPITEGRIGLRHMYTRAARYADFRVSVPAEKGAPTPK